MIKQLKRKVVGLLFCAEVCVFTYFYVCGAHGLRAYWQMREDNTAFETELVASRAQLALQERELERRKTQPFYKEKIAREQLQMARDNEQIYYLT